MLMMSFDKQVTFIQNGVYYYDASTANYFWAKPIQANSVKFLW